MNHNNGVGRVHVNLWCRGEHPQKKMKQPYVDLTKGIMPYLPIKRQLKCCLLSSKKSTLTAWLLHRKPRLQPLHRQQRHLVDHQAALDHTALQTYARR